VEHPPVFDPESSACWTGTIPETFRQRTDSRRSAHPTHSISAIGPAAEDLRAGHEYCATPCAGDSPYGKLAEAGGYILLLGVTHESNTCLHMVEELAGAPYHMQDGRAPSRVKRPDGTWEEIPTALHLWRWDRNFPRVGPLLQEAGAQRDGTVGRASVHLIDARALRDILVPILRRDPLFLLADDARAEYERSTT
jgi:aminoglycoside 3-N-acetyltransferase